MTSRILTNVPPRKRPSRSASKPPAAAAAGKSISVLVAEDAPLLRAAFRAMLEAIESVSVVGEVPREETMVAARTLQPDVVLISALNPDRRHIPLIKRLVTLPKVPGVIYLSRHKDPGLLREFFLAGGSGCILDRAHPNTLAAAIRRAAAGRKYIDPDISDEVVVALLGERGRPRRVLSGQEEEVLRLIAYGHTYKDVARKMGIAPATVETYVARIREKLDLRERSDLVRYAITRGILKPGEEHDAA